MHNGLHPIKKNSNHQYTQQHHIHVFIQSDLKHTPKKFPIRKNTLHILDISTIKKELTITQREDK